MRKILSLILALCLGCVSSMAVTVGVQKLKVDEKGGEEKDEITQVLILSENNANVEVKLSNGAYLHKYVSPSAYLPDYTSIWSRTNISSTFGGFSVNITSAKILMNVKSKIKNVKIYYTGDGGNQRKINLKDVNNNSNVDLTYYNTTTLYNTGNEYCYLVTLDRLPIGNYELSTSGYKGGFVGIMYDEVSDANPSYADFWKVDNDITWDFSDVEGTFSYGNTNNYQTYAYFYRNGNLKYNADFDGNRIAFSGQFPIIYGRSTQEGTLWFQPSIDGVVRVTFSDTGDQATTDAIRRYLAINGERTDYWTCRGKTATAGSPEEIPATMNVTSGLIPVKANNFVRISALKEDGVSSTSICVTKVEFIKITDQGSSNKKDVIVGVTDDTFSQRIYSYDSNGRSVSKWIYGGYKNSTHGLLGGVEDNGIFYYSNDYYDEKENPNSNDTNAGGNITFMTPSGSTTSHWLSCQYGSTIYVPVDRNTSGTIELTCTQDDYKNDGAGTDRYFELHKDKNNEFNNNPKTSNDDKTVNPTFLPLQKTSSATFNPDDLTFINGQYYLKLVSHFDENYLGKTDANGNLYKGEMKVYNITVTMNNGDYTITPPETDYDHEIVGEHSHAVFNWTQGTVSTTGYHYGTLTMKNGAKLTGVNPDAEGASSGTETIHSYRNGDIVKYKTNYYGGLQLLSGENTVYTITPPPGYYITTSVRIHGHYNMNAEDIDGNLGHTTYVSSFGGGKWESFSDNEKDDTYIRFPRNDVNARTTTLDFTVPASESVDFQVTGYQIFGVIDAVLVPKEAVPVIQQQLYYHYNDKINVDVTEHPRMRWGGTINYTPNEGEELWWYYEPLGSKIASRGKWASENSDPTHDPLDETDPGVKDQNITKKFSVRNYKFVNATGTYHSRTDNLEQDVYDVEDNYILSNPSDISTMADGPSADGSVSLTIGQAGTYYFYIHNTATNFNSPLGIVTFDNVTGVEDITVEDNDETDDLYAPVYNIYGQRVDSSYRGIVICNGRKYVRK